MKAILIKLRGKVRGVEHLLLGAVTALGGFAITLLEKLQNQDITPLLQKFLPDGWTPAEAVAAMGVLIVVLHVLIGNQAKWHPPENGGGR